MKKLFVLSASAILLIMSANAQTEVALKKDINKDKGQEKVIRKEKKEEKKELKKLEGKDVSYQSKQAFIADFGDVPGATWVRGTYCDEVSFVKDGESKTAYYDYDAQLVGTVMKKTFSDLPAKAQRYIDQRYAGYTKGIVLFFDDNEFNETDMVLFGNRFDDADNYFIEVEKNNDKIVLQVDMNGDVSYFTKMK